MCTTENTEVLCVLNQFLSCLRARDNGILLHGGGQYLISKIHSASRTSGEENIASVTDVHRDSENNTLMTF